MAGRNSADHRSGVVSLISGGIDSSIMTGLALESGAYVWPLYVRQCFVWEEPEESVVRNFLGAIRPDLRISLDDLHTSCIAVPGSFPSRWAVDDAVAPPQSDTEDEAVYLPGRNLALLSAAAILARSVGAHRILLGVLDGNPFPDTSPAFLRTFERLVREGMGWEVSIETPLARLTKSEVLQLGARLPLRHTLSCLAPEDGRHCGRCNKCAERARAFRCAGLTDPALYAYV